MALLQMLAVLDFAENFIGRYILILPFSVELVTIVVRCMDSMQTRFHTRNLIIP